MKQILQDLASGETTIIEAPAPRVTPRTVLVETRASLISAGTERMLVEFGKASYIEKARKQPEKVRAVLEKIKTDGLFSTVEAVRSKLAQKLPLGYCNVGIVHEAGHLVEGFKVGDRVISNGPHADIVRVSGNLLAKIPDNVSDESATFAVVASIGLQGIRLAAPTLGENFVVTGAGLIGLLTIQLLRTNGCRVLAIDFDDRKLELAKKFGAEVCNPSLGQDPVAAGQALSRGRGVDGVIITASTASNDPVSQAAQMCRKRGRIILVGVVGLQLNRSEFYEKELSFQVSCSYGPGRYDPAYEEQGHDYPLGFVRWTEQRNFEAVLDMMSMGQLDTQSLVTHRYDFNEAIHAYTALTDDRAALGIVLNYTDPLESRITSTVTLSNNSQLDTSKPVIGFIGAGNYASRVLLPAFRSCGAQTFGVATSGGVSATTHGEKMGATVATSDAEGLIQDDRVNTVVVVTRHDSHAKFAASALNHGKHVFVEKPLAIDAEGLELVQQAYESSHRPGMLGPQLMVGFNRRFAPHVVKMKELIDPVREPKCIQMTMNAGAIPADHWTQDISTGGGRIIGEACHFVDLMRFLVGSKIVSIQARKIGDTAARAITEDIASIVLGFADGSLGTINYFANGAASFPKERVELFTAGRVLQLDNFRRLNGFGWPGFRALKLWKQDKGQQSCVAAFLQGLKTGTPAIPVDEIFEVAEATLKIADQLRDQR